ncbi:hypothetical protein, partial [Methylicorpusculum sp.]|uniref:hypothetical protein n=1 Tax=Methylicorpusculum sp. TaxID=2713644 RepID=UPI002ABAF83E
NRQVFMIIHGLTVNPKKGPNNSGWPIGKMDDRQHIHLQQHWRMRQAPFPLYNGLSFAGGYPILHERYRESTRSEEGAVARSTGVGGREPLSSLHGRIHGVLSGE